MSTEGVPTVTAHPTEAPPAFTTETEVNLGGVSILVVDDEADVRVLLKFTLKSKGAVVTTFSGAQSALDALEEGPIPDLILTDCSMPKTDGPTLVNQIRSDPDLNHIPIIFVSSVEKGHPLFDPMCATGCEVFPKPFDPDDLMLCVQRVLKQQEP